MAEDQAPRDERTEEPTTHRLEQARSEGRVPFSKEPAQALLLVAAIAWAGFVLPSFGSDLATAAARLLDQAAEIEIDGGVMTHFAPLVRDGFLLLAPLLLAVLLAAPLSALAQRSVSLTTKKLKPDLSRLDPFKGVGRLFAAENLVEFLKNTVKVGVALVIVGWLLLDEVDRIVATAQAPPEVALRTLGELGRRVLTAVAGVAIIIAAIDVVWQYISWRRGLMMTRKELKDELKSTEGHPEVKARIRRLQREMAQQRMLQDVPKAAVVITNPTHYAMALAFDSKTEPVPRVVAKGRDAMAAKIREAAMAARVPILSNPALARTLHGTLEVGDLIKPEHYRAVADIISFVMARRRDVLSREKRQTLGGYQPKV